MFIDNKYIVAITCITYNHEQFIQECLNGIVLQKTKFPFVTAIFDDASTDNEPKVLWNFINGELDSKSLQKKETNDYIRIIGQHRKNTNCTFAITFLKYNHFSVKKAKMPYYK